MSHGFRGFVTLGLLMSLAGCPIGYWDDDVDYEITEPVYMSYDELRRSVNYGEPKTLENIGRLYLYGNYFFLNQKNRGIHVFDNSDPSNPLNLGFINIPGNTELAIRSSQLYADSYVDLVTLDLSDIGNIQEVNRQVDVFPWDAYQNVPDDIYFSPSQEDPDRGVIVGYRSNRRSSWSFGLEE